jgi:hypothetical protein
MVGFETTLPPGSKANLTVLLLPENAGENLSRTSMRLDEWPKNR